MQSLGLLEGPSRFWGRVIEGVPPAARDGSSPPWGVSFFLYGQRPGWWPASLRHQPAQSPCGGWSPRGLGIR